MYMFEQPSITIFRFWRLSICIIHICIVIVNISFSTNKHRQAFLPGFYLEVKAKRLNTNSSLKSILEYA